MLFRWQARDVAAMAAEKVEMMLRHAEDALLDEVWGYERFPTTRTVDTHMLKLRRKLEADPDQPRWILTVHGQGYKFATV